MNNKVNFTVNHPTTITCINIATNQLQQDACQYIKRHIIKRKMRFYDHIPIHITKNVITVEITIWQRYHYDKEQARVNVSRERGSLYNVFDCRRQTPDIKSLYCLVWIKEKDSTKYSEAYTCFTPSLLHMKMKICHFKLSDNGTKTVVSCNN